ncbi:MAG TPA: GspE/PulE family protein, partial [bacterium]|nr:GspE/PulE family protein [bacterium]
FTNLISLPHGIVLVTGPTGSGKTTTLYGALDMLNKPEVKIVTVEDPIEYQMRGITQVQVLPKIDLTFARILRAFLRQDPDIMLVGETRDSETAEITIRAALTGHLVFSTLHTNDAAGAFTRLLDMGIESYLVASSVIGVLAQRLVRVICKSCKETCHPDPVQLEGMGLPRNMASELELYRGRGCEACKFLGYKGRTGIYEIIPISERVKELTMERASANIIKKAALDEGMKTLRQDGWLKVLNGTTTIDEVLRVTQEDSFSDVGSAAGGEIKQMTDAMAAQSLALKDRSTELT